MSDVGAEQGTGLQSYRFCLLLATTYISRFYFGCNMCVICNYCNAVFGCKYQTVEHLSTLIGDEKIEYMTTGCPINISTINQCVRCQG